MNPPPPQTTIVSDFILLAIVLTESVRTFQHFRPGTLQLYFCGALPQLRAHSAMNHFKFPSFELSKVLFLLLFGACVSNFDALGATVSEWRRLRESARSSARANDYDGALQQYQLAYQE